VKDIIIVILKPEAFKQNHVGKNS